MRRRRNGKQRKRMEMKDKDRMERNRWDGKECDKIIQKRRKGEGNYGMGTR